LQLIYHYICAVKVIKKVQVLLVDNYDSFTYNIVNILEQHKVPFIICMNDEIPFTELQNFTHIIISPGPKIPTDSGQIIKLIQTVEHTHFVLGICLGHQAIAQAFGYTLVQNNKPSHGVATNLIITKEHNIFKNINPPIQVGLYHSWHVQAPDNTTPLVVTSTAEDNCIMSLKHNNNKIHGVQFHPESYLTKQGETMLLNFLFGRVLW
jgi:anthranilate synthase component II